VYATRDGGEPFKDGSAVLDAHISSHAGTLKAEPQPPLPLLDKAGASLPDQQGATESLLQGRRGTFLPIPISSSAWILTPGRQPLAAAH
jgi:hypothetical protein